MKTPWSNYLLASLMLATPFAASAEGGAATVVMLTGKATALGADGTVRKLAKNDTVYSGDLVNSGIGSYINLKFADGAFFLLRPETRFQIEQYEYAAAPAVVTPVPVAPLPVVPTAPAVVKTSATPVAAPAAAAPLVTTNQQASAGSATSRAFFRLVKGGFRSVSGLIGKLNHDDYRVTTPVATIGIRGTSYSARLCEGACEDRDQIVSQLGKAGKAVAAEDAVLVTTVDEGGIELASHDSKVTQAACQESSLATLAGRTGTHCGAMFTSADGVVTIIPVRPTVELNERSLDPKACN